MRLVPIDRRGTCQVLLAAALATGCGSVPVSAAPPAAIVVTVSLQEQASPRTACLARETARGTEIVLARDDGDLVGLERGDLLPCGPRAAMWAGLISGEEDPALRRLAPATGTWRPAGEEHQPTSARAAGT